jgi:flagellar basal-body rod modification protein FlgD
MDSEAFRNEWPAHEIESQGRRESQGNVEERKGTMAAMAGILNHQLTGEQALTGASRTPMAGTTTGTSSSSISSSSSAAISANDFLTLLVTEMQNQDPTATTDPNEYINQLVSVNSLEQLIDINQTLSTGLGSSTAASGSGSPPPKAGALPSGLSSGSANAPASSTAMLNSPGTAVRQAPGNLGIPAVNDAANQVAHALDGRSSVKSVASWLSGAQ